MTYTILGVGNLITCNSSSTTQQSVDYAGNTMGNVTFNNATGSWQLVSGQTVAANIMTLTAGTLDLNSCTLNISSFSSSGAGVRTLTMGSAAVNLTAASNAWNTGTITNLTLNADTSTVTFNPATTVNYNVGTGLTFNDFVINANGDVTISGAGTFNNLTYVGSAIAGIDIRPGATAATINGTLTITGQSSPNRIFVGASVIGTVRSFGLGTTGVASLTNVDFRDMTFTGTNVPVSGTSIGDCGGLTGITTTAAVTRYWVGGTGNFTDTSFWSTSSGGGGGASMPLPQDTVILDANSGGGVVTAPSSWRIGKDIITTGFTGTPTFGGVSFIYGSVTLGASMAGMGWNPTFEGRGTHTLLSAGHTIGDFSVSAIGGTYTLQDDLTSTSTTADFVLNHGTFNTANFNMTMGSFGSSNANTRTLNLGTSTLTTIRVTATTVWSFANTTNLTFDGSSATIVVTGVSSETRTFAGGGLTYGTLDYTIAGSTGQFNITGSNTFGTINFSDADNARTLAFTAGTTTTITSAFNVNGTSDKLMSVQSITAATHTLSKSAGTISCDYLSLTNSIASGGADWYAGANSVDVSGNSGWIFSAAPAAATGIPNLLMMGVG